MKDLFKKRLEKNKISAVLAFATYYLLINTAIVIKTVKTFEINFLVIAGLINVAVSSFFFLLGRLNIKVSDLKVWGGEGNV